MGKIRKQRAKRYARHIPLGEDKRVRGYRTLPLEWSAAMAYVVGLLATDGCLSSDRRHMILTSRDRQLVETFLACLGRPIKYTVGRTRRGKRAYYAQFSDVTFYDWLLARGLTPRKSLTLGAIDAPDEYLIPLARGLLDGDGSVCVSTSPHVRNTRTMSTSDCGCSFFPPAEPTSIGFAPASKARSN